MKNSRNLVLATLIGISTFTGMTHPVYAQKIFVEQIVEQVTAPTADPELKKVLPLAFSDVSSGETQTHPEDTDAFTTLFVDKTVAPMVNKTNGNDKVMPINPDEVVGISTFFTRFHPGLDFRAKIGTAIHAIVSGTVNEVSYEKGGYGKYVVLVHHLNGKTYFSLYAHMKQTFVNVGDTVTSGTKIGEVGLTGHTTGSHLHFELHDSNQALDPLKFFAANSVAIAKK